MPRARRAPPLVVQAQFAPEASAPTLQELQQGAASGALTRLLVAWLRQQRPTPEPTVQQVAQAS